MIRRPATILGAALLVARAASALQDRPVALTLTEGTNIAAAVSPDGRSVAIDVLGRIWVLPRGGGTARPLTDELGDARQPAWSPDGRRIVFQSYRDGGWHLWSIGADGSGLTQHTSGMYDDREPAWSPDGRYLVFSSDRSGNYDLWRLELEGARLERLTNDAADDFAPAVASDGITIAFVSNRPSGPGVFVRSPDGAAELWAKTSGPAAGPAFSPDGRALVYQQFDGTIAGLMIAERGGEPRRLTRPDEDVFPFRAAWTSSDELVYTSDGLIRSIRPSGGQVGSIPFSASIEFVRRGYQRAKREFDATTAQPVLGIVSPAGSPDGRSIAFVALGDLWLLTGGRLTQLTDDPFVQSDPMWSPDGTRLAYVSDQSGSPEIWIREIASGRARQLSRSQGGMALPSWSPDGRQIAVQVRQGLGTEIHLVDVETGESKLVRKDLFGPSRASWSPDGKTLAVAVLRPNSARFREGRNEILLSSLTGAPDRSFVPLGDRGIATRGTDGPAWSPDGKRMAFVSGGNLWSLPVGPAGEPVGAAVRLSDELAATVGWSGDSRSILYQTDDGLRRLTLDDGRVEAIPVPLIWRRWNPVKRIVIHAGKLWSGSADRVSSAVDVVLRGHRIAQVVPHRAALHRDSVVDGSALMALPGLADAHAHLGFGTGEALGRTWLAYGITTIRDPASDPFEIRERREAVESGVRVGPRELATGRLFDGERIYYDLNNGVTVGPSLDRELARADRFRFDLIKTYVRLSDVLQRRVVEFAHRHGIAVSSHELYPAVAFGVDHVEHIRGTSRRGYSPKVSMLYRSYQDVVALLTASGMTLTPTMGIQGGFFDLVGRTPAILDDPRLAMAYGPSYVQGLRAASKNVGRFSPNPAMLRSQGETVRRVVAGGGRIIAGTDAPIIPYGLSLLTELEHYVEGGLTPAQALATATGTFAEAMGLGAEIGSIAPGRLADLVLVEGNPLERIADLRRARIVIKNGEVFTVERLIQGVVARPRRSKVSAPRTAP